MPRPSRRSRRPGGSRHRLGRDALGLQHLAGQPEGLDAGRDPGVDGDLEQGVPELVQRAAVAQRAAEVGHELLGPVERGEETEVVEAALAVGQRRATPHAAPAVLGHELLELVVEAVGGGQGTGHVLLTEDARARVQPDVVALGVHRSPPRIGRSWRPYDTAVQVTGPEAPA